MSVKEHYQQQPGKPLKFGFILTLCLLGLIFSATAYMFISLTQNTQNTAESQNDSADSNRSRSTRSSRSEQKMAALAFQKQMLEKENELRSKYDAKRRAKLRLDKPDRQKAYRNWRDQKEQNERHLAKFKNDHTKNPASVKVQLRNTAERYAEDRPER